MVMSKSLLLESYLLLSGDGQRQLQQLPDYTSPPLEDALKTTPEVFRSDDVIQLARDLDAAGNCTVDGNRCHIPFEPPLDEFEAPSRVGVVFYNGGLVDPRGYSPLATLLNERYGIPVVIPIFASDLAFKFGTCDSGRLDFAKAEFPEVEKWILAGHSFGGVAAMVDMWARWNAKDESAAGLALLAADVQQGLGCGETDFSASGLPMAQVLAANDGVLNSTRVALNSAFNSNATFDMEIYGANHASFGTYNSSRRFELFGQVDGEALVSDSIVRDLAGGAIASVAIRTGVPLATRKESASTATVAMENGENQTAEEGLLANEGGEIQSADEDPSEIGEADVVAAPSAPDEDSSEAEESDPSEIGEADVVAAPSAPDEDSSEVEESSGSTCLKHGGPLVIFTLLSWNLVAFTVWN